MTEQLDHGPNPNATTRTAHTVVGALVQRGVSDLVLAPGSRSTALVIAARRHGELRVHVVLDERDGAFFALGLARATGRPAAVLTTSGTATANLLPAVMEADVDEVPLVVITADRPAELMHSGANQTVDQTKLFGDRVRAFVELPAPPAHVSQRSVGQLVAHAVDRARGPVRGPSHLNVRFRKPFEPGHATPATASALPESHIAEVHRGPSALGASALERYERAVRSAQRGLVVIGRLDDETERAAARRLAQALGWPVYADVLSGLRLGEVPSTVVPELELTLASPNAQRELAPDVVLHLGKGLVSGRGLEFLRQARPNLYLQVGLHERSHDPNRLVTDRIIAPIASLPMMRAPSPHLELVRELAEKAKRAAGLQLDKAAEEGGLSEPGLARELSALAVTSGEALFVSSSMPIRDLDRFGLATPTEEADSDASVVEVAANRGASGIDGVIATATGFALGKDAPTTLVIGDVALLHDVGALVGLKPSGAPLRVVVVNNRGGGIFSFLPVHEERDVFETCFGTPHDVNLAALAEAYGVPYHRVESADALFEAWATTAQARPALIEVRTNRDDNLRFHRHIDAAVANVLQASGGPHGPTEIDADEESE